MRKRLFVPNKSEDGPDVNELDSKRVTHVKYTNGEDDYIVNDEWTARGAQRAMPKYWRGTTTFYFKGQAPGDLPVSGVGGSSGSRDPPAEVLPPLPVSALAERRERKHRGSQKPNWIDSASWVSISPAMRADMIKWDKADKEL